jgi:hypothetical protein
MLGPRSRAPRLAAFPDPCTTQHFPPSEQIVTRASEVLHGVRSNRFRGAYRAALLGGLAVLEVVLMMEIAGAVTLVGLSYLYTRTP